MLSSVKIEGVSAKRMLSDDFEFFFFSSKVPEFLHVVLN